MKPSSFSILVALVLSSPISIVVSDPAQNTPPTGTDVIQLIFDQQPKEQGFTFDRTGIQPEAVLIDGKPDEAWMASVGTTPETQWMSSFRFKVTDSHFQVGNRPAVDVEILCYVPGQGPITVRADTAQGNKQVFGGWGLALGWQTFRFSIDDAFFGTRQDTSAEKPSLEGFDLRIDHLGGPLYVKSIRLVGYDTAHDVVWPRMLRINSLATQNAGGLLAFQKGPSQKLEVALQNIAQIPIDLHYRLRISDYSDKQRSVTDGKITLQGSSKLALELTFDTSDWLLAPYDGTLELYSEANPKEILLQRTFKLGVISSAVLEKARQGEFLYGLDAANTSNFPIHTPTAFAYYKLMGVDILRSLYGFGASENVEDVGKALKELAAENVQGMLMSDPPKEQDPVQRDVTLKQKDAFLEEVARLYGGNGIGKIHFFELGNEPDLTFFYPGPIADYTASFYEMRDAIKTGASKAKLFDSDTVVVNGGLSFSGADGAQRSEDFIQGLDPAKIDAIAYHGHGPDIHAERSAYERVYAVAQKYDKASHPFIETESGFSGLDRLGLEEQARTVVEKMVYAQSKKEPTFMFFRLFMVDGKASEMEGGYGMTDNFIEPHPSVLVYRNLVERLRHYVFSTTLDLSGSGGLQNVDGFLFEEKDAQGGVTGRKVAVLFAENPIQSDLRLRLDAPDAPITEAILYDMYGNSSSITVPDNLASIPVGLDPIFLSWKSSGMASQVAAVPTLLSFDGTAPLLANADNKIEVTVHNADSQPMDASMSLTAATRLTAQTEPSEAKIAVPANQTTTATFTVKLGKVEQPLRLPLWWKAFTDVDLAKANLEQATTIPDSVPGLNGPAPGQFVWATNNHIDFAKIAGGFGEKRPALAFAYLDSPQDIRLPCAASADWWMAWYVNGTKVYDTLDAGNGGVTIAGHTFDLPLKKGRNLIAVEVLSGSGGWSLDFGGPKERQVALTAGGGPDMVTVTLQSGGKTLGNLIVPVRLQDVVPAIDAAAALDQLATWMPLEPLTLLDDTAVKNLWMKEPDATRWYGGKKDLSAIVWLRDSGDKLQLYVAVTDDKLIEAATPDQLAQADSLRVALADDAGKPLLDVIGGLIGDKPILSKPEAGVTFSASREAQSDKDPQTLYRLEIPKSLVGAQSFRLNLSVSDNDDNYLKQTLDLGDVNNPGIGVRLKTND